MRPPDTGGPSTFQAAVFSSSRLTRFAPECKSKSLSPGLLGSMELSQCNCGSQGKRCVSRTIALECTSSTMNSGRVVSTKRMCAKRRAQCPHNRRRQTGTGNGRVKVGGRRWQRGGAEHYSAHTTVSSSRRARISSKVSFPSAQFGEFFPNFYVDGLIAAAKPNPNSACVDAGWAGGITLGT